MWHSDQLRLSEGFGMAYKYINPPRSADESLDRYVPVAMTPRPILSIANWNATAPMNVVQLSDEQLYIAIARDRPT